jgi:hypothetical protein
VQSPLQDIKNTWNMLKNPRMMFVIPMMVSISISIGTYGGIFVPLMVRTMKNSAETFPQLIGSVNKQNEYALMSMTLLGLGEIFGGNIIGNFRDKYGNRAAYTLEIVF